MKRISEATYLDERNVETFSRYLLLTFFTAIAIHFFSTAARAEETVHTGKTGRVETVHAEQATEATAVFGGGCFWCMEPPFEKVKGVNAVISGYSGGKKEDAEYGEVSSGRTEHIEVVEVRYDPSKVSYQQLLDIYWRNIDPTTPNRQFCDKGAQYRSAIFYSGEEQKRLAQASKEKILADFGFKVVTELHPLEAFYPAEEYHQDYYKKNPDRYYSYRKGCGRDRRLSELWGEAN